MTQDKNRRGAVGVIVRPYGATNQWTCAEEIEVIAGDEGCLQSRGSAVIANGDWNRAVVEKESSPRKRLSRADEVPCAVEVERHVVETFPWRLAIQDDDSVLVEYGQAAHEN